MNTDNDTECDFIFPMNWPAAFMAVGLAVVLIGGCVTTRYIDLVHPEPAKVEAK